jgi:hypothetical protein
VNGLIALNVLAQFDAVDGGREEIGEACLTLLKRKQSLILAVQFEHVERIKDDVMVTATRVRFVEKRKARLGQSTTASPSIVMDRDPRLARASRMRGKRSDHSHDRGGEQAHSCGLPGTLRGDSRRV